ncbi:hypothetical protein MXB_2958 [Myxobolus squamalis]|nr:hypothetical protein MXB_2958 [Myxobolus squamalis]
MMWNNIFITFFVFLSFSTAMFDQEIKPIIIELSTQDLLSAIPKLTEIIKSNEPKVKEISNTTEAIKLDNVKIIDEGNHVNDNRKTAESNDTVDARKTQEYSPVNASEITVARSHYYDPYSVVRQDYQPRPYYSQKYPTSYVNSRQLYDPRIGYPQQFYYNYR